MTFPLEHSSVLCAVIKHCMQSCKRTYGRINWEEVASKFNGELIGYDLGNAVVYSDIDCHNHWKYLAYGGSKNREALLNSSQDHCNSDEVTVWYASIRPAKTAQLNQFTFYGVNHITLSDYVKCIKCYG